MALRNILISLMILIAASLSAWSILMSNNTVKPVVKAAPNQPDIFMEGVIATIMSQAGKPKLKIEAPHLIHYSENDVTELKNPHVIIYRDSPQPWHINSNHAKAQKGISEITFYDNVIIHHLADTDNPLTTLRTSILTVLPEMHIAKTNEAVTVTQPDTTVYAVGMHANWHDGIVKLLSQAREEYVPTS